LTILVTFGTVSTRNARVFKMFEMPKLAPEEARNRAERAARALAADERVKLVFLFGSAADLDRTISVRDVDLAILTGRRLTLYELLDLKARAAREAGGEIDLVPLNDASVVLVREVAVTGRCLYSDPPELETEFVTRANMRYLDFKWYLDRQWEILGERLEARRGVEG
jgi:predicted nucleotidyltransferase